MKKQQRPATFFPSSVKVDGLITPIKCSSRDFTQQQVMEGVGEFSI